MDANALNGLEFVQVKVVALAVSNAERAMRIYGETLGLPPANIRHMPMAFLIGNGCLLLIPQEGSLRSTGMKDRARCERASDCSPGSKHGDAVGPDAFGARMNHRNSFI